MILKVIKAEYIKDYILKIFFNNGETKYVDFASVSKKGICTKLADLKYFKNFKLDPFSIDWNDEIGFAPEFLLSIGSDKI